MSIPSFPENKKEEEKYIGLDKSGYQVIIFLFLNENICCGYSLEAPRLKKAPLISKSYESITCF